MTRAPDTARRTGLSSEGVLARRPALFRALGRDDPPAVVEVSGFECRRVAVLKHDSWAATALYEDERGQRVACKFNRIHSLLGIPMAWAGNRLARREQHVLVLMADIAAFPRWAGPVASNGQVLAHAVAHGWIDGKPFAPWLAVDDAFFPWLHSMVAELHARGLAYVDMPK